MSLQVFLGVRKKEEKYLKRWNGWGDTSISYNLPAAALLFIEQQVGPGTPPRDVSLETVLAAAEKIAPRLAAGPLINLELDVRLRHARGQSLPDLIALRSGQGLIFPDGVAYPSSAAEVRQLLAYAVRTGAKLIPYGGGTSVVGHINPAEGTGPNLTVNLSRLSSLINLDTRSGLATFGAGISGANLEAQLRAHGCTLGHFPQSFEYSTGH